MNNEYKWFWVGYLVGTVVAGTIIGVLLAAL
jgi:hypothetical protein